MGVRGVRVQAALGVGLAGAAMAAAMFGAAGSAAAAPRPVAGPVDAGCEVPRDVCELLPVPQYGWGLEPPPGTTTDDIARDTSRGDFTAIAFNSVRGPKGSVVRTKGVVGVDVTLGDEHTPKYAVCKSPDDPYHGACSNANGPGYTFVKNWYDGGRTNFYAGLIIANSTNKQTCPAPCLHYWGQRVVRVDVELYPKTPEGVTDIRYVRPRFAQFASQFNRRANGGTYGKKVGDVWLSTLGDPGIASLDGTIRRAGLPVGNREVALRLFQQNATATTTTGQRLQSFATPVSLADGTYTTGAVYSGRYLLRVIDSLTGDCRELRNVELGRAGHVMDFELTDDGFGQEMTPC